MTSDDAAARAAIESQLQSIWAASIGVVASRLDAIDSYLSSRVSGLDADDKREPAMAAAHKLAGTLGTFRIPDGSKIAAEMERHLAEPLDDDATVLLLEDLVRLRALIEAGAPGRREAPAAPATATELLVVAPNRAADESLVIEARLRGMRASMCQHADALARLSESGNRAYDAVIIDTGLVDEGLFASACELVEAAAPLAPVFAVGAPDRLDDRMRLAEAGAIRILGRRVPAATVIDLVDSWVRRSATRLPVAVLTAGGSSGMTALVQRWPSVEARPVTEGVLWEPSTAAAVVAIVIPADAEAIDPVTLCTVLRSDQIWSGHTIVAVGNDVSGRRARRIREAGADDVLDAHGEPERTARRLQLLCRTARQATSDVDPVSGLPARERLRAAIAELVRDGSRPSTVLWIGLTDVAAINERSGYSAGDMHIRRAGELIAARVGPADAAGRWTGAGFAVALGAVGVAEAERRCTALRADLRRDGIEASVGYATAGAAEADVDALVRSARRRARESANPSGGSPQPKLSGPGGPRPRVLIVEDDEMIRLVLREALAGDGFDAESIDNGTDAAARLSDPVAVAATDLVLLDVSLPGIDGFAVLRAMNSAGTRGRVPVVMLTARTRSDEVLLALDLGAADHIGKPFAVPVVLRKINQLLGRAPA